MSKDPPSPTGAKQYVARAASDDGGIEDGLRITITKAIFRDGQIVIEWPEFDGLTTLTELTKAQGSKYTGKSVWGAKTPHAETAAVEAVLYSNEYGYVLVGVEKWSGGEAVWFIVQLLGKPFA
jgi:hypothetical protein